MRPKGKHGRRQNIPPSKTLIQNCFFGTFPVPAGPGTVGICDTYVLTPAVVGLMKIFYSIELLSCSIN